MANEELILNFESKDSAYFIRFGDEKVLKCIKTGKIWFRSLNYYKNYEDQSCIGDENEGVQGITQKKDLYSLQFSHPLINNGIPFDITSQIVGPIKNYPNNNIYISCFSYLTQDYIFDEKLKNEKEWSYVIIILESSKFLENLKESIGSKLQYSKVNYYDENLTQYNLNTFSKSKNYQWQKEFRFAFNLDESNNTNLKK